MSDTIQLIIVALIAAAPGLYAAVNQRRSNQANVAAQYEELAAKQLTENARLQAEMDVMKAELFELRVERKLDQDHISSLSAYIDELIIVMQAHGMQPLRAKPIRKAVG